MRMAPPVLSNPMITFSPGMRSTSFHPARLTNKRRLRLWRPDPLKAASSAFLRCAVRNFRAHVSAAPLKQIEDDKVKDKVLWECVLRSATEYDQIAIGELFFSGAGRVAKLV